MKTEKWGGRRRDVFVSLPCLAPSSLLERGGIEQGENKISPLSISGEEEASFFLSPSSLEEGGRNPFAHLLFLLPMFPNAKREEGECPRPACRPPGGGGRRPPIVSKPPSLLVFFHSGFSVRRESESGICGSAKKKRKKGAGSGSLSLSLSFCLCEPFPPPPFQKPCAGKCTFLLGRLCAKKKEGNEEGGGKGGGISYLPNFCRPVASPLIHSRGGKGPPKGRLRFIRICARKSARTV